MTTFQQELTSLLNKHSKENDSNTPDFILADYLTGCLKIFSESVYRRAIWYKDSNEVLTDREIKDIQDSLK